MSFYIEYDTVGYGREIIAKVWDKKTYDRETSNFKFRIIVLHLF